MPAALLLAASLAAAGPLSAPSLNLSTTSAQLGVPIEATALAPAGMQPDLAASTTDAYTISLASPPKEGKDTALWTLRIIPLAVGVLPIELRWNGAADSAVSRAQLDVAQPALPRDADISDIKRPAAARPALWPWLLGLGLIGAAVYGWRRLKRKNDPDNSVAASSDLRTPAQRALDELASLERSDLWREASYRDFYFLLTEILRGYFERRYGMPALKLTTHELGRQLRQAEAERQVIGLFKDLFDRADLVKFAKTRPSPEQGGLDLAAARRLIELSAPRDLAAAQSHL